MSSKKRSRTHPVELVENEAVTTANDSAISKPLKKKMKKQNKIVEEKTELSDKDAAYPSAVSSSSKDMEQKKKRKAFDKERRQSALDNGESSRLRTNVETKPKEILVPVASASSNTLPEFHISVFKDLASSDVSIREAAAESLVRELQDVQDAYEKLEEKDSVDGGFKLEAEKNDGLNNCAPSLRYAVRRLIRGVSSSRECARQGFALGLTMLVGKISSIKVDALLKLIVDSLEVSSSMKGQEARDCFLGRLFAYGGLAQSDRLNEEWISDKNTPYIKEFTSVLIALASKKRYLQEPAVSVLLQLVEKLPIEALLSHVQVAPGLPEWFAEATDVGNPDALLLALKIREKNSVGNLEFGKLLPNPYSARNFFSADHLSSLVNCLKETTFCQPRVHSVWPVLINMLLPENVLKDEDTALISSSMKKLKKSRKSSSSEDETAKNVQCFCEIVIEGVLLVSSHDRKHLALDILLLLFPRLPASFLPVVLSFKVVQCLMDILSTKNSWLYKVAQHFLKELLDWVRNDDLRRVAVIVALQKHSNGKFDSITRTRTVKDLMVEFKSESGSMLFIQNLMSMFLDEGHASEEPSTVNWELEPTSLNSDQSQTTDDNSEIGSTEEKYLAGTLGNSDSLKTWVIESLPSILKYLKLDPEAKFRVQKEILKFLAVQGLFSASLGTEVTSFELQEKFRWPKVATSTSLCMMCIEQLQLLIANAQKMEGSQSLANSLEPNDLGSYFMRFLSTLRNIPSVSLFRTLSDEDEKAFKNLHEMETKLYKEEINFGHGTDANKLHALRYLLIQLLLQVLLRPVEFSGAASELILCCKKTFPAASDLIDDEEDELDDDDMPEVMDVLVDTLLSLLPQSSAPLRSAIEQVFKYFCHDVTDAGMLRMLRIIKKDLKPARHQVDSEDDEDDDEDFLGIEEDEEIDEAETGETGESDELTDDDSDAVVGIEGSGKELSEGSDDSDGGMDDDAMFRMDTYLAQIFKEKKNQAGSETAQSQLALFKLRILSLLEIYLHENPGKPQVLTIYSNLVRAFINPHTAESSEQLGQRIWGILQKKIFKAKDIPKGESVELSLLESLLKKNLKLASKPFRRKKSTGNPSKKQANSLNRHKTITTLGQNSTFWILKIVDARNFTESELQKLFDVIKTVLVGYFDSKRSELKSEFLKEMLRRRPWIGHHLFPFLLEKCSNAKSDFRRVEALDLVSEILKTLAPLNDDNSIQDASRKAMKTHLPKLSHLIKELVTNMPEKKFRRLEVLKFCKKIFQIVSSLKLTKPFIKDLSPDVQAACEAQFGDLFLDLKECLKNALSLVGSE